MAAADSLERRRTLRLLLVEDDQGDVALCLAALASGGFDVDADVVTTVTDFRAALERSAYDVVLSDYRLPQWTGMDALRVLRDTRRDIPFILVSGALGEERAVDCLKEGVTDYILKSDLRRLGPPGRQRLVSVAEYEAALVRAV